jgi:hypothetical protein
MKKSLLPRVENSYSEGKGKAALGYKNLTNADLW